MTLIQHTACFSNVFKQIKIHLIKRKRHTHILPTARSQLNSSVISNKSLPMCDIEQALYQFQLPLPLLQDVATNQPLQQRPDPCMNSITLM